MLQERDDQGRIDLLEVQRGRRDVQLRTRIGQQQLERVRVRVRGVRTGAALKWEALLKERAEMWRQRCHGRPPMTKRSQRSAMSVISSGTASRYQ